MVHYVIDHKFHHKLLRKDMQIEKDAGGASKIRHAFAYATTNFPIGATMFWLLSFLTKCLVHHAALKN